ncbi:MAG: hypothetical protein GXY83_38505 [Rhodopirellula sp.]|nr:hypothetical protein [Rhodopirellula sp.]
MEATKKGSGVFFRIGRRPRWSSRAAVMPIRKKTPDPLVPPLVPRFGLPVRRESLTYGLLITLVLTAGALASSPLAVPVDGEPLAAGIAAIDDSWNIAFTANGGSRQIAAADLVRWGNPRDLVRGPVVVLADGGWLAADVLQADKETLRADSAVFGPMEVPLELLRGIVFQLPLDQLQRDLLLDDVSAAEGNSDELILANGDRIAGRLEAIGDAIVQIQSAVGPVDVERRRLRALIFNPSLLSRTAASGLRALVGLSDGSLAVARQLVLDKDSLKVTVSGGFTWNTAPKELVYLQPLGGRATYVSDLEPAGYRHVSFLDWSWPYRADRNVTGGRLRAGDLIYAKGLGMHSAARITYVLDGDYARFDALAAIDDSTAGQGSVGLRVFVDGSVKFTSPTVRGGDAAVPVSVDLHGAKRLDLIVDFADRADVCDHADWLDARIVRER